MPWTLRDGGGIGLYYRSWWGGLELLLSCVDGSGLVVVHRQRTDVSALALAVGGRSCRLSGLSPHAALLSIYHRRLRVANPGGNYSRNRYNTYAVLVGNGHIGSYLALTIVRSNSRVAAVRKVKLPRSLSTLRRTFGSRSTFRYKCYAPKRVYSTATLVRRIGGG